VQRVFRSFTHGLKLCFRLLLAILAMIVLYLCFLIMSPQDTLSGQKTVLSASPAFTLTDADALPQLMASFPGAMLCADPDSGWTLRSGFAQDVQAGNTLARLAQLQYTLPDGSAVLLSSVTPADSYDALPRGTLELHSTVPVTLSGLRALVLEDTEHFALYAQSSACLYRAEFPLSMRPQAQQLSDMLQLTVISPDV